MFNQQEQEITNLTKSKILLKLKDLGVKSIRINFSGSGDSGDIDDSVDSCDIKR